MAQMNAWKIRVLFAPACMALCLSTSCRKGAAGHAEAEWWILEGERAELASKVELLNLRLAGAEERTAAASAARVADRRSRETLAALEVRAGALRQALPELEAALDGARAQALADRRAAQAGRELASLRSSGGREFTAVRLIRATEAGIEFHHATGIARLTADDLTPAQQEEFGIDASRARDLIASEQAATREYHRKVDEVVARQREEESRLAAMQAAIPRTSPVSARPSNTLLGSGSTLGQTRRLGSLSESPRSFGRSRYTRTWWDAPYVVYRNTPAPVYGARTLYGPRTQSPNLGRFAFPTPPRPSTPPCPQN